MDALLHVEVAIIVFLQQLPGWFGIPMRFFTFFGFEEFYMLVFPLLYWCVDASLGIRMGVMLILSNGLNTYLKLIFHAPRPYWFDSRVKALSFESSFGLPSGHAQNAASVWGLLGREVRRVWGWSFAVPAALVVIFLIGFSRLYLGVHFLRDVLVGWLVGFLLLWIFGRLMKPVERWLSGLNLPQLLALSAAGSLALIGIMLAVSSFFHNWQAPVEWVANISTSSADPMDPLNLEGIFTVSGVWFGFTSGAAWMYRVHGGISVAGTWKNRLLRYLVGMVGVVILYTGLGLIFPDSQDVLSLLLRFVRYTLIGAWVAAGAPLLFAQIGLTERDWRQIPVQSNG